MTSASDAARRWDAEAVRFDDEPDHGLGDPDVRAAWRALVLSVLPTSPARIADLGCGTGTLSVLLADEGYVVAGVDVSPAMLQRAREKAGQRSGVTFTIGDAADPQLAPASYDVVLCRHVLWALPDPVGALRHWVELLNPGGSLVLIEGAWHTGGGLSAQQTVELLQQVGRPAQVTPLPEPIYWGGEITDERYLVVSRSPTEQ